MSAQAFGRPHLEQRHEVAAPRYFKAREGYMADHKMTCLKRQPRPSGKGNDRVTENRFDITRFLDGTTRAYGLFEDRFGRIRREFSATLDGRWDGDTFVLREDIHYRDGAIEHRVWRIQLGHSGSFVASCDDCIGVARGQNFERSWRMTYRFRLRMRKRSLTVSFDDRVQCLDQHLAMNRATIRKWGLRLGEAFIVFERSSSGTDLTAALPSGPHVAAAAESASR